LCSAFEQLPADLIRELSTHLPLTHYQKLRSLGKTFANILDVTSSFSRFCPLFSAAKSCGTDFACDLVRARNDRENLAFHLQPPPQDVPKHYPKHGKSLLTWLHHAIDNEKVDELIWCLNVLRSYTPGEYQEPIVIDFSDLLNPLVKALIVRALDQGWWAGLEMTLNLAGESELSPEIWATWMATTATKAFDSGKPQHALRLLAVVIRYMTDEYWEFETSYDVWKILSASWNKELPLVFLRFMDRLGPPLSQMLWNLQNPCSFLLWTDDPSVADEIVSILPGPADDRLVQLAMSAFKKSYVTVAYHVTERLSQLQPLRVDLIQDLDVGHLEVLEGKPLDDAKVRMIFWTPTLITANKASLNVFSVYGFITFNGNEG